MTSSPSPYLLDHDTLLTDTPKSDRDTRPVLSADTPSSTVLATALDASTQADKSTQPPAPLKSTTAPLQTSDFATPTYSLLEPSSFVTKYAAVAPVITGQPTPPEPPSSHFLRRRQEIWRDPSTSYSTIHACQPVTISSGTLLVGTRTILVSPENTHPIVFHPMCIDGRPVLNAGPLPPLNMSIVPSQQQSWSNWVQGDGQFNTSVVPLMYAIAASSATCWLVTIAVLGFQRKRPLLYKLVLLCSSIFLLLVLTTSTDELSNQFHQGFLDSTRLRHCLSISRKLNIMNLTFNTIVYLGQVQSAMRLFNRQKEKRLLLWLGGSVTIIAQTIWGVSVFHPNAKVTSLPAFAYLFQIAMSVLYIGCVSYYIITKRAFTLCPSVMFFTLLEFSAACSSIVLFIIDLASIWIIQWSDSMSWVTSVLSIVTVWELADKVYALERRYEKNGVLGRQTFDSDPLFDYGPGSGKRVSDDTTGNTVRTEGRNNSDYSGSTFTPPPAVSSLEGVNNAPLSSDRANITYNVIDSPLDIYDTRPMLARYFYKATYPILYMSDLIISIGLSVSRPLSESSSAKKTPTPETLERREANLESQVLPQGSYESPQTDAHFETIVHPLKKNRARFNSQS